MSKKHNTKHDRRSPSRYPDRLRSRGESSVSVRMPFIDNWGRRHDTIDEANRARAPKRGEVEQAA